MSIRFMTPGAQVVVAHACPVLAAGIATSLRRLPGCEVRLWGDPARAVLEGPGPQIVIGDRAFVAGLLARRSGSSTQQARFVIVSPAPSEATDDACTLPEGVDARLTVPCAEQEFFALVRRLSGAGAPGSGRGGLPPRVLQRVLAHIESRLGEGLALSELAAVANLSDGHFSRAFKRSVGLPPHRYLLHRRIVAAVRLMARDEQPLAHMALSLGFSDQSQFTRQFSALTGTTPGAYRRGLRSRNDSQA